MIRIDGRPFATYVTRDEKILRPYFTALYEPGGVQVTRNHPPVAGKDPTDHDTMHPGIWLAFGDLSGSDFWRNKGRVDFVRALPAIVQKDGRAEFGDVVRYVAPDGRITANQTSRFGITTRPAGTLLSIHAAFTPVDADLVFGDQEEMGLGVRVATPISVKSGGRIVNSDGLVDEKGVWGKQARWCDYSGAVNGRRVGVCLMPHPDNFRASWFHARDYGLLVANPFGRQAFTKGEPSRVVVKKGESLRLRFGVLVYGGTANRPPDLEGEWREYLRTGVME
jgi:hypothetical protein